LLIPVSVQYLIRGNLEPPLTMAVVAGMYAFVRSDTSGRGHVRWRVGFAAALTAAVFFKGMQGLIVAIFAGLYWLCWSRDRARFFTLVTGIGVMLLACLLYEWRYRSHTGGEEFWLRYIVIQAGIAVKSHAPLDKLYNLIWYLGRALYFALPWSVLLLSVAWNAVRRRTQWTAPQDHHWRWLVLSAGSLIIVMALFERKADRYIFPSYTLLAMAGGWLAWERFPRVRVWLDRPPQTLSLAFAATLMLMAILKIVTAAHFYRVIQIWRE
jgi:4-amino-4-deoxy-L-arabinose transferase-like glycosyltransferase